MKKKVKRRSPHAKALEAPQYRKKVIPNKKRERLAPDLGLEWLEAKIRAAEDYYDSKKALK